MRGAASAVLWSGTLVAQPGATIWMCWKESRAPWRARHRWSNGGQTGRWPELSIAIWRRLENAARQERRHAEDDFVGAYRSVGWLAEADQSGRRSASNGVTDAAAVVHILRMPDAEERRSYAMHLAEELAEFGYRSAGAAATQALAPVRLVPNTQDGNAATRPHQLDLVAKKQAAAVMTGPQLPYSRSSAPRRCSSIPIQQLVGPLVRPRCSSP